MSTSGDATVGSIDVEKPGVNMTVTASGESHIHRVELDAAAGSSNTEVDVKAVGKATIDNVITKAEGAKLSVVANENATVGTLRIVDGGSASLSGTSPNKTIVDVSKADVEKAKVVIETDKAKIETAKGQNLQGIVDNQTGKTLDTQEKKEDIQTGSGKKDESNAKVPGASGDGNGDGGAGGDGGGWSGGGSTSNAGATTSENVTIAKNVSTENGVQKVEYYGETEPRHSYSGLISKDDAAIANKEVQVELDVKSVDTKAAGSTAFLWAMSGNDDSTWSQPWVNGDPVELTAGKKVVVSLSLKKFRDEAKGRASEGIQNNYPTHFKVRITGTGEGSVGGKISLTMGALKVVEKETASSTVVLGPEKITNGTFADGTTGWSGTPDENDGSIEIKDGKANIVVKKKEYGVDENNNPKTYAVQLQQKDLSLYKGCKYRFSCDVTTSGVSRKYGISLLDPEHGWDWYGGTDGTTSQTVSFDLDCTKNTSKTIALQLNFAFDGASDGDTNITVDNVSLKLLSGEEKEEEAGTGNTGGNEGNEGNEGAGGNEPQSDVTLLNGITTVPDGMAVSDSWTGGNKMFVSASEGGSITCAVKKDDVKDGAIYDAQVTRRVKIEGDSRYVVSLDATLSGINNKRLQFGFQHDGASDDDWRVYNSGEDMFDLVGTGGKNNHLVFVYDCTAADDNAIFFINIGQDSADWVTDKEACDSDYSISLSNIKITKVEKPSADTNLITNGSFSGEGENYKQGWDMSVTSPAEATFTKADNGVKLSATSLGSEDWHINMKQYGLTFKKGKKYMLTFTAIAGAATTIKPCFMNDQYIWFGGYGVDIGTTATEYTVYSDLVTASDDGVFLQFTMGKVGDAVATDITISNVKLVEIAGE